MEDWLPLPFDLSPYVMCTWPPAARVKPLTEVVHPLDLRSARRKYR